MLLVPLSVWRCEDVVRIHLFHVLFLQKLKAVDGVDTVGVGSDDVLVLFRVLV